MKCFVCGYDEEGLARNLEFAKANGLDEILEIERKLKPFIELHGATIGPWFTESSGKIVGVPATLYACPNCGTVRMEV